MARFFNVALCLAVVVVAVSAQFDFFGGYPGGFGAAGPRDPRDNRGPVTFPVTSGGSETSGVRIGASGYGFVPPGSRGGAGPYGSGPSNFEGLRYW
ncbi:collagen alpha-2(I) chain [Halyomorpha halys]|uniref:collagen alpha-2(I) chain n=1 Tax=Halyomorpha halys TaxID=286706 RepID=UPI0006D4F02F|nr:collagen alpha-2(I) chain [Halyomorpha halys]